MTAQITAGTAADRYRAAPAAHPYRPDEPEPGYRPRCRVCGSGRGDALHAVPSPRISEENR